MGLYMSLGCHFRVACVGAMLDCMLYDCFRNYISLGDE